MDRFITGRSVRGGAYGGRAQVRRRGHPLYGQEIEVTRLHLVYDAKMMTDEAKAAIVNELKDKPVQVHFK